MTTVNRLYEVVHQATYAGQEIVNRWNYLGIGDDGLSNPSFGLASALGAAEAGAVFATGSLFLNIALFQTSDLVYHQCLVRSIYVPTDFIEIPYPTPKPGTGAGGQGEPPFVALGFRSNRVRTDIGRGYKRFAGLTEGEVDAQGIISSGIAAGVTALANQLGDTLTYVDGSFTWNFHPVIVGKEKIPATLTSPVKYRYYSTEVVQADHLASGIVWEGYPQVRSQVSRQYGKGA